MKKILLIVVAAMCLGLAATSASAGVLDMKSTVKQPVAVSNQDKPTQLAFVVYFGHRHHYRHYYYYQPYHYDYYYGTPYYYHWHHW